MLKRVIGKKCETCGIFDWCAVTILASSAVKRCFPCWLAYYRSQ